MKCSFMLMQQDERWKRIRWKETWRKTTRCNHTPTLTSMCVNTRAHLHLSSCVQKDSSTVAHSPHTHLSPLPPAVFLHHTFSACTLRGFCLLFCLSKTHKHMTQSLTHTHTCSHMLPLHTRSNEPCVWCVMEGEG